MAHSCAADARTPSTCELRRWGGTKAGVPYGVGARRRLRLGQGLPVSRCGWSERGSPDPRGPGLCLGGDGAGSVGGQLGSLLLQVRVK